jgi:uncharacterized protein (DUF58 family)
MTAPTTATPPLLDPPFLRKIERLSLVAKKVFTGQLKGERRSAKRGTSVEFADYRNYALGDDLRYVDWNTYARLEKLFLKLFLEEEDLHVYLLVDGSASMNFGEPSKFDYARRIAAALGYVGLANYDRVGAAILGHSLRDYLAPVRGRGQVFRYFNFLSGAEAEGPTSLAVALRDYSLRCRRTGIAILISDFLDPAWEEGLKALLFRKFQTTVIQVLDAREVQPDLRGDLKLIDSETGAEREISISPGLLRDYQRALEGFCGGIEQTCRRYGADYLRATTDVPFEDLVLKWLRSTGLVK